MADARLQVVAMPPGGVGLREALNGTLRGGSVVTAYDDVRLLAAHAVVADPEEVEFVPFGDLVGRVMRMAGIDQTRLATRAQKYAMASLACRDLDEASPLAEAATTKGVHRLFSDRLDELAVFGVDARSIKNAAECASPSLSQKLTTLGEVHDLVQDSMDVSRRETLAHRIHACWGAELDTGSPLYHLVVVAGREERPLYDAWLEWLASTGVEVAILVDLVPIRDDLFKDSHRTMARLTSHKRKIVGSPKWYECLFTGSIAEIPPYVSISTSSDTLSECEWVVRDCLRLIDDGTPPGAIGILARESESYSPLLTTTAGRFGLDLDISRTVPLLSCGLAAVVSSVLRSMIDIDARTLLNLAANSYFRVGRQTFLEMESVLRGSAPSPWVRWENIQAWADRQEAGVEWLRSLLAWRGQHREGHASLSTWLESLRQIIGEMRLAEASASGDPVVASRDVRAQAVLQRSLADHAFVYDQAGQSELSLPEFVAKTAEIWEDETVTFESLKRGVKVAHSVDALPDLQVLFVMGMLEGSMPRRRREDPLLDDDERSELSELVGQRLQDSHDEARRERDEFVRLCATASDQLAFSYPLTGEDRDNVPAYYLEELDRTLGGRIVRTNHPRGIPTPTRTQCVLPQDILLRDALEGPREWPGLERATSPEALALLHPDWEEGASVAELSKILVCPFQSSFQFRLKLRPPSLSTGFGALLDLPRVTRLAEAKDPAHGLAKMSAELDSMLDRLCGLLEPWEHALLRAAGRRLIAEWVEREFSARKVWPRDVGSVIADVGLEEHGLRSHKNIDGKPRRFKGRLASVSLINGVSVGQLYLGSEDGVRGMSDELEREGQSYELGLTLMAQKERSSIGTAVEVDGSFGKRYLAVLPSGRAQVPGDSGSNLYVSSVAASPMEFFRAVNERFKESVKALDGADARAKPGPQCESCTYGDLCRRSSVNAEESSPFGGGDGN